MWQAPYLKELGLGKLPTLVTEIKEAFLPCHSTVLRLHGHLQSSQ